MGASQGEEFGSSCTCDQAGREGEGEDEDVSWGGVTVAADRKGRVDGERGLNGALLIGRSFHIRKELKTAVAEHGAAYNTKLLHEERAYYTRTHLSLLAGQSFFRKQLMIDGA